MVFCAIIEQIVVGNSDRTAFFKAFDFGIVAKTGIFRGKRAFGASCEPSVTQGTGSDNGDGCETAWKFVLEEAILGPGIEPVEYDGFLACRDEVFGFGYSLATNPIFAFSGADHFAEFFFATAVRGTFDATFGHFGVDHITKVDLGDSHGGEAVDDYGFTATGHTDNGENVEI